MMQIWEFIHTQHHNTMRQPKAKHDIAMVSVDKFPYLQKQTRCLIHLMLKRCLSRSEMFPQLKNPSYPINLT